VNSLRRRFASWRADNILRRVVRNSGYLLVPPPSSAVLSFAQGIFAVRLIGMDGYGLVSGWLCCLLPTEPLASFRMSEVVVKYLGEALAEEKLERAAAIAKALGWWKPSLPLIAYLVFIGSHSLGGAYVCERSLHRAAFRLLWAFSLIEPDF